MIVYLAEPMDFASGMGREIPNQLASTLAANDMSVFRPSMAWLGPMAKPDHVSLEVVRQNRAVLDRCGMVVAYLPSSVRTLGVPMEIAWATDQGKPVVVISDHQHSTMLNGNPLIVVIDRPDMLMWAVQQARQRAEGWSAPGMPGPIAPARKMVFRQMSHGGGLSRAHAGDAGFDLFTVEDVRIEPGGFGFISCGVQVAIPDDCFGWVVARSSAMSRWGLIVTPGVIDSGFRGELGVPAYRAPRWPWPDADRALERVEVDDLIPRGTRLAQLVVLPNVARDLTVISTRGQLPASLDGRAQNGFGSTGSDGEPVTGQAASAD